MIAVRERRGTFPTETLLKMSLAGDVNIEECTSFFERITGQVHVDMLRPSWLIFAGRARDTRLKIAFREMVHRSLALIGLIISLPIAILTAILIKLESKGPIFYRQERVGKNGRVFKVIKFRSMRTDAEADGKPVWATADDDRVTRVGRIIRKIRVDEIPQFWNIIKGEMSFVGPRPERPHFVAAAGEGNSVLRASASGRAGIDRLGADQISVRRVGRRREAKAAVRSCITSKIRASRSIW